MTARKIPAKLFSRYLSGGALTSEAFLKGIHKRRKEIFQVFVRYGCLPHMLSCSLLACFGGWTSGRGSGGRSRGVKIRRSTFVYVLDGTVRGDKRMKRKNFCFRNKSYNEKLNQNV